MGWQTEVWKVGWRIYKWETSRGGKILAPSLLEVWLKRVLQHCSLKFFGSLDCLLLIVWKFLHQVSCVDELCEQLCYHLELAYFAALVNSGRSWQADESKIFGNLKGQISRRDQDDQPPAETFVANLVLERLAMNSPLRVGSALSFLFTLLKNWRKSFHIF